MTPTHAPDPMTGRPLCGATGVVNSSPHLVDCPACRKLTPPVEAYCLGLDLGQSQDPSALAVNRVTFTPERNGTWSRQHAIVYLKRWQLKTPYTVDEDLLRRGQVKPGIAQDLREIVKRPPLYWPRVAVDYTGVGRACVDIFRAADLACNLWPVCITAGQQETVTDGNFHVPKKSLVACTLGLFYGQRLALVDCPERKVLLKELDTFRMKISVAGNESFEAWREKDHDDLVFAVMLSCWLGERSGPPGAQLPHMEPPSSPTVGERHARPSGQQRRGLYGLKRPDRRATFGG